MYLHLTSTDDILASLLQCLFHAFAFFRHALPLCSSSLSAKVMLCLLSSEYQLQSQIDVNSLMVSSVRVLENGHHLCLICDKTNKQRGSMQRHMREIHVKSEQYHCPLCDSLFSSRSVFYSHFNRVHKTNVPDNLVNFRVK